MRANHDCLSAGTGKLHVNNPSEKWGELRRKSLTTFYAVAVVVLCFRGFFWFFLAAFNWSEAFEKKVDLKIFKFNNPGGIYFWSGFKLPSGNLTFRLSYVVGGFQGLCLKFKLLAEQLSTAHSVSFFFFVFYYNDTLWTLF